MSKLDPIKEAQAAASIRESLARMGEGDDEALLLDSIEGQTSLLEVFDAILSGVADDQAMIAAVEAQITALKARKDRFAKRVEARKALIEQAFVVADLPKIERPLGTLYLSTRAPKVIVETESDIPAKYWKAGEPVLDGKQLLADLKTRRDVIDALPDDPESRAMALALIPPEIPGATLSNGLRSLSIRTA